MCEITKKELIVATIMRATRILENAKRDALAGGHDRERIREHSALPEGEVEETLRKGTSGDRDLLEAESRIDYLAKVVKGQVVILEGLVESL